ncbi:MAG: hypothetical protein IKA41_05980 [Bacteroidaceae bacterium]|nr:hypothetical protein [Bacteroidaceae bacterium]
MKRTTKIGRSIAFTTVEVVIASSGSSIASIALQYYDRRHLSDNNVAGNVKTHIIDDFPLLP